MSRVYLDHNATTPLRAEARDAMLAAMDVVGNPSSVHAEGRASKMLVERARTQVASLVGCLPTQVVFTGSATEAAALAVAQKYRYGGVFVASPTEHDCFGDWSEGTPDAVTGPALVALSGANSETGVMQADGLVVSGPSVVCDITQMAGKVPVQYGDGKPAYMILSAHKLGGPKGVGALINFTADDPQAILRGGGQEMGRRSGTENVIGIAGFGAAAEAAQRDVEAGKWVRIEKLRNILESALAAASNTTIFVGKGAPRLPNTTCFATPGWKGETQVMQMDLSGFAISAGSACSSGKVKASKVLTAMGLGDVAAHAVRVSLGLETTEDDVLRFAAAWAQKLKKHEARAA
ncbi:aminotransferase class V-fold PLP-dependent enzyme [uncultured Tateyamaria sp.]|uniref:cysteine desulfurase family protein n=1 Tax=uncultured Tateyamaria sp. TaxID=455651 RepID=UPI002632A53E|nr:aminotransferase class V-fold PLP-dependent enzyme [uncultured Tateyamaria sp.]